MSSKKDILLLLNQMIKVQIPKTSTNLAASGYSVPKSVINATRVIKENLETKTQTGMRFHDTALKTHN